METIRVLLADDQLLFVESLRTVLEMRTRDIRVVGIAHDGDEAIECAKREHPDIVLMDVRMPQRDGVEATRVLRQEAPDIRIVMLTTYDDDEYVHSALQLGAVGYLLKNISPRELIASLRAVKSGAVLISPSIAAALVGDVTSRGERRPAPSGQASEETKRLVEQLTSREKQVLLLVLQACSNKEIADRLFIAEQTVKNHVSDIYAKLGVDDRVHLLKVFGQARIAAILSSG